MPSIKLNVGVVRSAFFISAVYFRGIGIWERKVKIAADKLKDLIIKS